jgi:hypothetical protein
MARQGKWPLKLGGTTVRISSKSSLKLALLFVVSFSAVSALAGEPAWWTQKKADCHLSPSLAYNDWVAQGSPCNTASSGASTTTSTDPAVQIGHDLGNAIGQALVQSMQQVAAERERRRQQMANENRMAAEAEAERLAEQARKEARQNQSALDHLQGVMKFSDSDAPAATVAKTAALPSNSAKVQLTNSGNGTTGQLFDGGKAHDDAVVDARLPNVATPSSQAAALEVKLARDKGYQAATADLTKAQATADAVNKKMANLQEQQKASPTPERQIEISNLSGQASQANGAVAIATNNLDSVKKKIIESGPAIVVDDNTQDPGQSKPASDSK